MDKTYDVNGVRIFLVGGDDFGRTIIGVELLNLENPRAPSDPPPVISFDRDRLIEMHGGDVREQKAVEQLMTMLKSNTFKTGIKIREMEGQISYLNQGTLYGGFSDIGFLGSESVIKFSEDLKCCHSFPNVHVANAVNLLDLTVVATKVEIRAKRTPKEFLEQTMRHAPSEKKEEYEEMSRNPNYTEEAYFVSGSTNLMSTLTFISKVGTPILSQMPISIALYGSTNQSARPRLLIFL